MHLMIVYGNFGRSTEAKFIPVCGIDCEVVVYASVNYLVSVLFLLIFSLVLNNVHDFEK